MIKTEHLTFTYDGQENTTLYDINLRVRRGGICLLFGPSGSGKSTLLKLLKKEISPKGELSGKIFLGSDDEFAVGYVAQNPDTQIVTSKVYGELAFGLENMGLDRASIHKRLAETASYFGIEEWFYRDTARLSGGSKQLLNLACVMAMEPELLLLDEPGAQLDPVAYDKFLNILVQLNRDFGTTIVLVEHRIATSLSIATQAAAMHNGRLVASGDIGQVIADIYENFPMLIELLPDYVRCYCDVERSFKGVPLSLGSARMWIEQKKCGKVNLPLQKNVESKKNERTQTVLKASNIAYYYGKKPVICGLDLDVKKGDIFAVLGGNGAGKTTLLKLFCGLLSTDEGKIKVSGKLCGVAQNPQASFTEPTVYEELEVMCPKDKSQVENMLELLELKEQAQQHPYDLSGGQMQRLAIGKALLLKPDILLLDEPTKGLDNIWAEKLGDLLVSLGITIVMVSHDVDFCASYATRAGILFGGQIVASGSVFETLCGNRFYTTTVGRFAGRVFDTILYRQQLEDILKNGEVPDREAHNGR